MSLLDIYFYASRKSEVVCPFSGTKKGSGCIVYSYHRINISLDSKCYIYGDGVAKQSPLGPVV